MLDIFKFHPNNVEKLKNFQRICIGENYKNSVATRCFYIGKTNKEFIEISYLKCLELLVAKRQ